MIRSPNAELAFEEEKKLTAYLLPTEHPRGLHKAAFFTRFGFRVQSWRALEQSLLGHARESEVVEGEATPFGAPSFGRVPRCEATRYRKGRSLSPERRHQPRRWRARDRLPGGTGQTAGRQAAGARLPGVAAIRGLPAAGGGSGALERDGRPRRPLCPRPRPSPRRD